MARLHQLQLSNRNQWKIIRFYINIWSILPIIIIIFYNISPKLLNYHNSMTSSMSKDRKTLFFGRLIPTFPADILNVNWNRTTDPSLQPSQLSRYTTFCSFNFFIFNINPNEFKSPQTWSNSIHPTRQSKSRSWKIITQHTHPHTHRSHFNHAQ